MFPAGAGLRPFATPRLQGGVGCSAFAMRKLEVVN